MKDLKNQELEKEIKGAKVVEQRLGASKESYQRDSIFVEYETFDLDNKEQVQEKRNWLTAQYKKYVFDCEVIQQKKKEAKKNLIEMK